MQGGISIVVGSAACGRVGTGRYPVRFLSRADYVFRTQHNENTGCAFGVFVVSVGNHLWVMLWSFWDNVGIMLGSFGDMFLLIWEYVSGNIWGMLGSFWDRCGIMLGSFGERVGIILGSLWDKLRALFFPLTLYIDKLPINRPGRPLCSGWYWVCFRSRLCIVFSTRSINRLVRRVVLYCRACFSLFEEVQ